MSEPKESFLARWSRLKQSPEPAEKPPAEPRPSAAGAAGGQAGSWEERPSKVELPLVDSITLETDVTPFFQPEVDESLRRAALRKLFSASHFNVMDGLDVYIDDYSKPDPIPAALLSRLAHARDHLFGQVSAETEDNQVEHADNPPAGLDQGDTAPALGRC